MRERSRPSEPQPSSGDPNSQEYWTQHWNTFNDPRPTSRRAAVLGWLIIALIVLGGVAIALLFPEAR